MSEIQTQINRLNTIVNQNSDLINQNNKLVDFLQNAMQAEFAIGKIEVVNAINEAGGNATIEDSLATLAEKILALPVISPDTTFDDSAPKPINASYFAAMNGEDIVKAYDENVTSVRSESFWESSTLEEVNFPNAKEIGRGAFYDANSLKIVILPSCEYIGYIALSASSMEVIDLQSLKAFSDSNGASSTSIFGKTNIRLIDIITGANISTNMNFSQQNYNPTEAYSTTSASLVKEGEPFNTNNEKWNYNLREHFAANLQDRTGLTAFTITFGSTVLGKMSEETKLAFTNKNWTLA